MFLLCYSDVAMPNSSSPTKQDVQDIVSGAAEHIILILGERIDGVEGRLDKVETEIKFMRQDISNLKTDTPTQKAFNQLKQKVDRYIAP